jgi:hypothetical protein
MDVSLEQLVGQEYSVVYEGTMNLNIIYFDLSWLLSTFCILYINNVTLPSQLAVHLVFQYLCPIMT